MPSGRILTTTAPSTAGSDDEGLETQAVKPSPAWASLPEETGGQGIGRAYQPIARPLFVNRALLIQQAPSRPHPSAIVTTTAVDTIAASERAGLFTRQTLRVARPTAVRPVSDFCQVVTPRVLRV